MALCDLSFTSRRFGYLISRQAATGLASRLALLQSPAEAIAARLVPAAALGSLPSLRTSACGATPPGAGMTAHGQHSHLFDAQAAGYAEFRPSYPVELFERILAFAEPGGRKDALDLATGEHIC